MTNNDIKRYLFGGGSIEFVFLNRNILGSTHQYVIKNDTNSEQILSNIQNNHKLVLNKLGVGLSKINLLKQIHSNEIKVISENFTNFYPPEADGIVTTTKNILIAVMTADCVPVLLCDNDKKIISAVHAGWRGAKNNIIAHAVKEMRNLGAENISVVLGPHIRQDNYQVSQEFYDDFISEDQDNMSLFYLKEDINKYYFDLTGYVRKKLLRENIIDILDTAIDTFADNNYFSYRRSFINNDFSDYGSNLSLALIRS